MYQSGKKQHEATGKIQTWTNDLLLRGWHCTYYPIIELTMEHVRLRLMNYSKWRDTHKTINYGLFVRGGQANRHFDLKCTPTYNASVVSNVLNVNAFQFSQKLSMTNTNAPHHTCSH